MKVSKPTSKIRQRSEIEWRWSGQHHTTQSERKDQTSKMKQFGRQQQLRTPHLACRKVAGTSKCSRKEMIQNILMEWRSRTSWWIDRKLHGERTLRRSRYDWAQPRRDQDGIGKICVTDSDSRETEIADIGRTDELQCLPHSSSCWPSGLPPSLCCTESEDSRDFWIIWICTSNSLCLTHSFLLLCLM